MTNKAGVNPYYVWPLNITCPVVHCSMGPGVACLSSLQTQDTHFWCHQERLIKAPGCPPHIEWIKDKDGLVQLAWVDVQQPELMMPIAPLHSAKMAASLAHQVASTSLAAALEEAYADFTAVLTKENEMTTKEVAAEKPPYHMSCPHCFQQPGKKCRSHKGVIVAPHNKRLINAGMLTPVLVDHTECEHCGKQGTLVLQTTETVVIPAYGRTLANKAIVVFGPASNSYKQGQPVQRIMCTNCGVQQPLVAVNLNAKQLAVDDNDLAAYRHMGLIDAEDL